MKVDELRKKQISFLKDLPEVRKRLKELNKNRLRFIKMYSFENLENLELENYVCGTQKPENFCNWLERGLGELGSLVGSTAIKFGIYYSSKSKDYRFAKKWGINSREAYQNVLNEIINLLLDGEKGTINKIIENPLSPMFKGKILNIYFPDKFISILSEVHVDFYLLDLGVPVFEKKHVVEKRQMLLDFKNSDSVMKDWTNYEFSSFLYSQFGRPNEDDIPKSLNSYLPQELPALVDVEPVFVEKELLNLPIEKMKKTSKSGFIDFERKNKRNARIGGIGEHIVMKAEKRFLIKAGRKDLAKKIVQISQKNSSAGYDIDSFLPDGTSKKIEVKATTKKPGLVNFYISQNEIDKSKEYDEFYI